MSYLEEAVNLTHTVSFDAGCNFLLDHDPSVRSHQAAGSILAAELRKRQAAAAKEEVISSEDEQFLMLEQAMESLMAYDQMTLQFIKLYSDLGLRMEAADRSDHFVQQEAMQQGANILESLAWFVSRGINPSRFVRAMMVSLRKVTDPVTNEPPEGLQLAHQVFYKTLQKKLEEKELDWKYKEECHKALEGSDLFKDLTAILF